MNHEVYVALASDQHELVERLFPNRGEIYVKDQFSTNQRYTIATNRELDFVFADPRNVENPEETAKKLAPILAMEESLLVERLSKENDRYEPLKHKLSDKEADDIRALELPGIKLIKESWRFYPEAEATAHLTGFLGYAEDSETQWVGQYGLEASFDPSLAGTEGILESERAAGGQWITIGDMNVKEATDGDDIVTTIDRNIQFFACQKLSESVKRHGAVKGSVIVMEPNTGAILALCNAPSYDPNRYSDVEDINVFLNTAVFDQYEPGSVFKTFALGAALEEGKISPRTIHNDTGAVKIGKYTIRNSDGKSHGNVDFTFVLAESLNTGSVAAVQMLGNETWRDYVTEWGFGEQTGIELPSENEGNVSSLNKLSDIYSATSSFGQGITVTAMQLITAFSSIANGGYLVQPTIVDEVIKANGYVTPTEPKIKRQILSSKTSTVLGAMLVNVVDSGHAKRAGVLGYYVAGKTGTAQISKEGGVGYHEFRHRDTFMGFAPVENPKFVMLTFIDQPNDVQWAEGSAAPLFGEIAKFIFDYYHIPPTR